MVSGETRRFLDDNLFSFFNNPVVPIV